MGVCPNCSHAFCTRYTDDILSLLQSHSGQVGLALGSGFYHLCQILQLLGTAVYILQQRSRVSLQYSFGKNPRTNEKRLSKSKDRQKESVRLLLCECSTLERNTFAWTEDFVHKKRTVVMSAVRVYVRPAINASHSRAISLSLIHRSDAIIAAFFAQVQQVVPRCGEMLY